MRSGHRTRLLVVATLVLATFLIAACVRSNGLAPNSQPPVDIQANPPPAQQTALPATPSLPEPTLAATPPSAPRTPQPANGPLLGPAGIVLDDRFDAGPEFWPSSADSTAWFAGGA